MVRNGIDSFKPAATIEYTDPKASTVEEAVASLKLRLPNNAILGGPYRWSRERFETTRAEESIAEYVEGAITVEVELWW